MHPDTLYKVRWREKNAINYLVFTHSYMFLLLAFLLTTFIGPILLYGHTSPNRYVFIIIKLHFTQHIYRRKKCYVKFAYVQLHTNLAFT